MKPLSEFRDRLFKSAGGLPEQIMEFSCDHIIPPENILPIIITKSLDDKPLLFNYENRFSMVLNNLQKLLNNIYKLLFRARA